VTLLDNFNELINSCFNSFSQRRIAERVKSMAIGLISCYGRHTVTGMLTGCGKQFVDWSAAYRIFSQNRINIEEMNRTILKEVASIQASSENIVAHMDDTLIRKKVRRFQVLAGGETHWDHPSIQILFGGKDTFRCQ
jgi:hypothetical protein